MTDVSILESIYPRLENKYDSQENILDWLMRDRKGDIVRHATSKLRDTARQLAQPGVVKEEIESSETFAEVRTAGTHIDEVEIEKTIEGLKIDFDNKQEKIADDFINELRPSSRGRESLKRFIKGNDYDLEGLKWHLFKWKGRDATGFWDSATGSYITWFPSSVRPTEIEEAEPSESIVPEEVKEEE